MANLKPLPAPILLEKDAPPRGSENVQLVREAFNRKEFNDTINTNFTELGVSVSQEQDLSFFDPNLATVEDFFNIYNNLFLQIPKGNIVSGEEINSHIFLIERSTAYTNFIAQQEEIDALAQEITDLRAQNLELVADMANIVDGFEQTVANLTE
jgi:hypothetical protein